MDAIPWASLDYDGRKLKGLTDGVLGPILDADGKPLRDERLRDSEGMALASGDAREGTAFVSFEQRHRLARYPFNAERFGRSLRSPKGPQAGPAICKAGSSAARRREASR